MLYSMQRVNQMTSKLRQSNEKYYYDLKRLRTGSLLKDADTYYVVLGFGSEFLEA